MGASEKATMFLLRENTMVLAFLIVIGRNLDVAHQEADWNGIHEKICQLLIPIRTAPTFLSSAKERKHNEEQLIQRQKHLINLTRTVAQKLLFEGKHEEAIPGALQSLRFAAAVYGSISAEQVPSQLLLAEASIAGGYFHMANVFYRMKKMDIADSLYSEVTNIWNTFLGELVEMEIQKTLWKAGISSPEPGTTVVELEDVFDEAQEAEAVQILHAVFDLRNQAYLPKQGKIGKIALTLAMLYYLFLDFRKRTEFDTLATTRDTWTTHGEISNNF
ncbi:hypothetical protein scyTo_0005728 [Scyliorhinus torazame]|uniref:Uncharacterized protein n=1 Tax=Scyliorhinus torazame TaxID=75743 RepID=A0A401PBX4_SCYTO|nr:hypothetical protein [Scyliorhinus torazame]